MTGEQWVAALFAIAIPIAMIVGLARRRDKWGINVARTVCPGCGTEYPRVRRPANWRQAMWGGGTCGNCGMEVDKWGNPA